MLRILSQRKKKQNLRDDFTLALSFNFPSSFIARMWNVEDVSEMMKEEESPFSQNTEIRASIKMINFMAKIARMDYFIFFILCT